MGITPWLPPASAHRFPREAAIVLKLKIFRGIE
jgi:hypothetical protein